MRGTNSVIVSLVAAVAQNGVIGNEGGMPWHLPGDLAHFRRLTLGKPVIMGRRTFFSIGRPLPDRYNIVVTRSWPGQAGVVVASGMTEALSKAVNLLTGTESQAAAGDREIMIIGGAQIYAAAMPYAGRLYLTRVDAMPAGDTWFPEYDSAEWRLVSSRAPEVPRSGDSHSYRFERLDRTAGAKQLPGTTGPDTSDHG